MTQTRMRMTPTEFGEYWVEHATDVAFIFTFDAVGFLHLYNSPLDCIEKSQIELLDEPV